MRFECLLRFRYALIEFLCAERDIPIGCSSGSCRERLMEKCPEWIDTAGRTQTAKRDRTYVLDHSASDRRAKELRY
jgi:hypothetical protein